MPALPVPVLGGDVEGGGEFAEGGVEFGHVDILPGSSPEGFTTLWDVITVQRVGGGDSPDLVEAYDQILAPSFPTDELEPFPVFAEQVGEGRRQVWVARLEDDEDGEIVAVRVARDLPPSDAVLLTHIATRQSHRGTGVGSHLHRALLANIVADSAPSLVLAEVAHPDHHESHPRHGNPLARLRFYGRFDARILDVPYYQASLGPGLQPVYGLLLLVLYARPDLIDPAQTRLENAENLLAAVRTMLEWDGEPDDAAAAALLTAVSQSPIRLLPVTEYRNVVPGLRR